MGTCERGMFDVFYALISLFVRLKYVLTVGWGGDPRDQACEDYEEQCLLLTR